MTAIDLIFSLQNLVKKHGNLAVYIPDGEDEETESAGIRYYPEYKPEIGIEDVEDTDEDLPERFFIKS